MSLNSKPLNAPAWDDEFQADGVADANFKALSREEALALRGRMRPISAWRVVASQAVVGLVCVLLWGLLSLLLPGVGAGTSKTLSALYGVIAVVLPNALMAWGMTRRPAPTAAAAFLSLFLWESIKILLTTAILVAVVRGVKDLSWLALLTSLFLTLKVNWLALLLRGRSKSISDGN